MSVFPTLPISVLYKDSHFVAFYKPAGMHVHPHENPIHRVPRSQVLLHQARDMIGEYLYPVHRLDAATSGVIIFALDKDTARILSQKLQTQALTKTYEVVVRGWLHNSGFIDLPLELDSTNEPVESLTEYMPLAHLELPWAVSPKHSTSRFTLVRAWPKTGRFHQIRRHFARISHPVLGDAAHGDSKQNKFFREKVGIPGLCLRAAALEWNWLGQESEICPELPSKWKVESPLCAKWQRIHELFEVVTPSLEQATQGLTDGFDSK
jgi:tRNA pseudouridine65 synthase